MDWVRRISHAAALLAILCVAAALRFHGGPFFHPDEHLTIEQAKYMPAQHYQPSVFNYPSFYPMLLAFVREHWPTLGTGLHGPWATRAIGADRRQARAVTAALGTLTVLAVYLCGAALGWPYAGLAGAAFLAVSLNHVENSHYATVDVPLAFNATVAFLFTCLHYRRGRAAWALLAGIFCGLAIGTKYNGAVILAPFAFCLAAVALRRRGLRGLLGALTGIAGVPYGFFLANPYFIAMHAQYLDELRCQIHLYAAGFPGNDDSVGYPNWIWNALYLARHGMGLLPALLALAGCLMLPFSGGLAGALAACFPVLYYAYISHQAVRITRNLTVLIPFLCLAAGYALWRAGSRARHGRGGMAGAALLAAVALAQPLLISCRYAWMMGLPDPREKALAWAQGHMPRGCKIAVDYMYGPRFPESSYLITSDQLGGRPLSWYLEQRYDFIVTSTGFFAHWNPEINPAISAIYPELDRDFTRVAFFPGNELGLGQDEYAVSTRPDIAVYNLRLPRYAAARIKEPAPGATVTRSALRIAWSYTDVSGGGPQTAYRLRLERKRPGVRFVEAEELLARAPTGGWQRQSHIPGYLGEGFICAPRNAPPFRGTFTVERPGVYTVWAHQDNTRDGRTRFTLAGLTTTMKGRPPNQWLWERLGTCALEAGEQTFVIEHVGEGYSVLDSLVLSLDGGFDPARDGEWVTALDTGETASAETSAPLPVFAGLEPGEYRAAVSVRNAAGRWGVWSEPVTFRLVP